MERITVNLAPADLRKEGAAFDLPMAVGILAATGLVKPDRLDRALVLGELSLDGRVCPVRGVLPVALSCRRGGFTPFVVPADNAAEAAAVGGLRVIPVATLQDTVDFLNGEREPPPPAANVGRWLTAPVRRRRRLRRRPRSRPRQARARDRRRGGAQRDHARAAGRGEDHARPPPRGHPAAAHARRGDRGVHGVERERAPARRARASSPSGRSARPITPPPTRA